MVWIEIRTRRAAAFAILALRWCCMAGYWLQTYRYMHTGDIFCCRTPKLFKKMQHFFVYVAKDYEVACASVT